MRSRYRVRLAGVHLDSLDNDLLILDVQHSEPEFQISENRNDALAGYDYRTDNAYFRKTTVTVTFELHIYDVARRNAVCQKVNQWAAAGGSLATNDRPDQILRNVRCEKYASIASAKNWTDPLTLVFATTYVPYWQSSAESVLNLSGKAPKGTLKLDGNTGEALVSVEVTAKASITSFKITVGDTNVELKGLSLTNGQQMVIDYARSRYLRIRVKENTSDKMTSVMSRLQPKSTDVLKAPCGAKTSVSISANNKVSASIKARGLWL